MSFTIKTQSFEGPLDLLLDLIEKRKLYISDISLAKVTDDFIEHVKNIGNIEIGEYSRIGAGSVVLKSVPPHCTAVGVPAKLVNCAGSERPSQEMDQFIDE